MPISEEFTNRLVTRLRELAGTRPVLVVEGKDDKTALMPFLIPSTEVISADGKEKLLAAYRDVPRGPLRDHLLFIMDCDGETSTDYKGEIDLVLTTNRDIESDVILQLNPSLRAGVEVFGSLLDSGEDAVALMDDCIDIAGRFSALLGLVLMVADSYRMQTRTQPNKGALRKLAVLDIVRPDDIKAMSDFANVGELVAAVAHVMQWGMEESDDVLKAVSIHIAAECRRHRRNFCPTCLIQRSANGHHFVQAIAALANNEGVNEADPSRIASILRTSTQVTTFVSWPSIRRIRTWQEISGCEVLGVRV